MIIVVIVFALIFIAVEAFIPVIPVRLQTRLLCKPFSAEKLKVVFMNIMKVLTAYLNGEYRI